MSWWAASSAVTSPRYFGWLRFFCQNAHTASTCAVTASSVSESACSSGTSYHSNGSLAGMPPRASTAARTRLR